LPLPLPRSKMLGVEIRRASESDAAYVSDTYANQTWGFGIPRSEWRQACESAIALSISRGGVLVASSEKDPGQIFAWCRVVPHFPGGPVCVLDYVYVRSVFRGFGLAADLVTAAGVKSSTRPWRGLSVVVPLS
jgi:hypothetical protein